MSDAFQSLLPPNAAAEERALEAAAARLAAVPVPLADLWHPQRCPSALLPWLAWTVSVDEWDSSWDDTTKRQVIAESIAIHLKKGSRASVERILQLVGYPAAQLIEWWQTPPAGYERVHSSEPHTFSIGFDPQCSPTPFDPKLYQRLSRLLAHTVPVRSHMCMFVDTHTQSTTANATTLQPTQVHRTTLCVEPPPRTADVGIGAAGAMRPLAVVCLAGEL